MAIISRRQAEIIKSLSEHEYREIPVSSDLLALVDLNMVHQQACGFRLMPGGLTSLQAKIYKVMCDATQPETLSVLSKKMDMPPSNLYNTLRRMIDNRHVMKIGHRYVPIL